MRLVVLSRGDWQALAPRDSRGRCPVLEALDDTYRHDRAAHAGLLAAVHNLARCGPPHDERRSRRLARHIYELKTPRGYRVFYFFQPGRVVVCPELLRKPKPRELQMSVRRAQRLRDDYAAAWAAGRLLIEREG
jgi:hypothetical protein